MSSIKNDETHDKTIDVRNDEKYSWRMSDKKQNEVEQQRFIFPKKKTLDTYSSSDKQHDYSFQDIKRRFFKKENKNLKKILCHNILTFGSCNYGGKCLFAHKLDEQNINDTV